MRILGTLTLLLLAVPGFAQGADTCTSPTVISGLGPHAFNNSAATGPQGSLCATGGRDVWFRWIAPTSGTYTVSTCGTVGFDTILAVYNGTTCPGGAPIACNDDDPSCGLQSTATFTAVAGNNYVVQVASYGTGAGGAGTFTFAVSVPCSANVGPDVIVGDLNGVANHAVAGSFDAISLGTTSCNIGDTWLNWISSTNQHPVIGGNLYRYRVVSGAGRFEQIGQSWLKHGFFALSQNLCCPNCSSTDGTHLGVGCSDPYTADRNGSQSGLGPRRQVNATTGAFAYPPANPSWSGSTARRLQFATADIDTAVGVRYFGESQYVSPDDALAGNNNNNASYREMSTNGSDFSFVGSTQREKSAIEAWLVCESGVTIDEVQADGLFHVAYKVTNLGGGQYHYEFAVHNLNSHRSGGSFSIPVGTATITNIGFRDVAYSNGDGEGNVNFSGTDWTATNSAGVLTWATETEGANSNANALRWGTTYNFRFDANVAPVAGTATLGLWRAGAPGSVTALVEVPGGATNFAFCFGDGSGTACPCANNGASGNGCASSVNANGANLSASGASSISSDTLTLSGTGMPNSSALYFQGTSQSGGGAGAAFGDGKRCAAGTTIRLGTKTNAGGASSYPVLGDQSISIRGANAAGNVRTYQCWYRNAAAFCTANTFNLTNGYQVTWTL